MVIVLCECNFGIAAVKKLPPHYHYKAGHVTMPSGEQRWIAGCLDGEQREFIHFEASWDRAQARDAIEAMMGG